MFSSRFVLVFFLLTIHIHVIHAQNDMPLLAQLQGEHNASHFGNKIISLDFNHDGFDDLVVYSMAYGSISAKSIPGESLHLLWWPRF